MNQAVTIVIINYAIGYVQKVVLASHEYHYWLFALFFLPYLGLLEISSVMIMCYFMSIM